nr:methyltransferase [Hoeflea prorocentri]
MALEKSGDAAGAAKAYRQALALDPQDHGGVSIRLAALGLEAAPEKMPDAYVAMLFDQHADEFDEILVERLRYSVPMQLRQLLRQKDIRQVGHVLDLGCGTGLTGMALNDCAERLTGVDLSEQIVELAYDREVYDDLYVGEAVAFLEDFEDEEAGRLAFDMVVATDVFPYLGDMEPIVRATADRLVPGGLFGFSTETLPSSVIGKTGYTVGPNRRFAHDPAYVRRVLVAAGFELLTLDDITVRFEEGHPVPGHLVLARLTGDASA